MEEHHPWDFQLYRHVLTTHFNANSQSEMYSNWNRLYIGKGEIGVCTFLWKSHRGLQLYKTNQRRYIYVMQLSKYKGANITSLVNFNSLYKGHIRLPKRMNFRKSSEVLKLQQKLFTLWCAIIQNPATGKTLIHIISSLRCDELSNKIQQQWSSFWMFTHRNKRYGSQLQYHCN